MTGKLFVQAVIKFLAGVILVGALVFLSAGTFDFFYGWLLMAILFFSCLATSLSLFTFMHWRRKWQPTPAFLPGESQGRGSLVGCRLWGHTESDTTELT